MTQEIETDKTYHRPASSLLLQHPRP